MKDTIQELRYEKDEIMKLMSKSQAKKIAGINTYVLKLILILITNTYYYCIEKDAEKKGEAVSKKSNGCTIS